MNNKINVEKILNKHCEESRFFTKIMQEGGIFTGEYCDCTYHIKKAIKEIMEAVVDRCAEEAEVDYFVEYGLGGEGTCCHSVKQESILQVKQMIDYDTD